MYFFRSSLKVNVPWTEEDSGLTWPLQVASFKCAESENSLARHKKCIDATFFRRHDTRLHSLHEAKRKPRVEKKRNSQGRFALLLI